MVIQFGKINIKVWNKIWDTGILKSVSVRIEENVYELVWRWYLTGEIKSNRY